MQKLYMILFSHEETRELLVAIEESPALNFASSAKRLRIRFSPPGPSSPTALPQAHHPQPSSPTAPCISNLSHKNSLSSSFSCKAVLRSSQLIVTEMEFASQPFKLSNPKKKIQKIIKKTIVQSCSHMCAYCMHLCAACPKMVPCTTSIHRQPSPKAFLLRIEDMHR